MICAQKVVMASLAQQKVMASLICRHPLFILAKMISARMMCVQIIISVVTRLLQEDRALQTIKMMINTAGEMKLSDHQNRVINHSLLDVSPVQQTVATAPGRLKQGVLHAGPLCLSDALVTSKKPMTTKDNAQCAAALASPSLTKKSTQRALYDVPAPKWIWAPKPIKRNLLYDALPAPQTTCRNVILPRRMLKNIYNITLML
mmetsp:Transcript_29648/g.59580  ORF Transcript_29648/g.59580 Transcript_29648/m.59580 type:complete len:203 (+) Transcript_29648:527-1135(+)